MWMWCCHCIGIGKVVINRESWTGYIGVGRAVRCFFATATGGRGFYWPCLQGNLNKFSDTVTFGMGH